MTTTISTPTSIQRDLNAAEQQLAQAIPPAALATINAGIAQLVASGSGDQSLHVGDTAPDFTLPKAGGGIFMLGEALRFGPAVVVFYRGEWCPYCNVQLRSYQQALAGFKEHNATLVAISPQTPDNSLTTVEQKQLEFPVLSDVGNVVSRQFGLAYQVNGEVLETLRGLGIDLAVYNGDTAGELPLTGTFVIDQDRVLRWAVIEADFRRRPDPADVLTALATITGR